MKFFNNDNYGFIKSHNLDNKSFVFNRIKLANNIKWAKTDSYNHIAKNHCGVISVLNLALYFNEIGYKNLLDNDIDKTFNDIYKIIKNGPVLRLDSKAKKYFKAKKYNLNSKRIKGFDQIKKSIDLNHPCIMLLMKNPFSWHYCVVVGYRIYEDKKYVEVIDNWHTTSRFYMLNKESIVVLCRKYYLDDKI